MMRAWPRAAYRALVLGCLLLAAGCTQQEGGDGDHLTVTLLSYQEQEAGVEPYPLRMLVDTRHLRFDDGYDSSDFMLMDRDTGTIYSVSHEDRSILVISDHPATGPAPEDLTLEEKSATDAAAPRIGGLPPQHVRLLANGSLCREAIVVPGLLEDAGLALAEYARALGNRQFSALETLPADTLTPCFLARYVYAPDRLLQHGLPVQEWDESGYRRMLVDYREATQVDPALFTLPQDYRSFSIGQ